MALHIADALLRRARTHAETTYPEECCGLLLGSCRDGARRIAEVMPLRNVAPRRHNRFDLDPREHLAAVRSARDRGLDVVGYYHSHPDHPAQPSAYDLEHAGWSGCSYLIVSVQQGRAADANSFELADDRSRFLPESITVLP
jgi:proteasome lid subunit RPN8/RPN11